MGGNSVSSTASDAIARIKDALSALKGKQGAYTSLYVDRYGRLYVRDSSTQDVVKAIKSLGVQIQDQAQPVNQIVEQIKLGELVTTKIASAGTVSGVADLGGHYAYLQIIIPTIDPAQLELQVGTAPTGTFQDFGQDALSQLGTGGYSDTWVLGGWRYIKIKASAAQSSGDVMFKLRGVTY